MNKFVSVIMAVVLVCAVGGSMVNGTMASFFDTEVSTDNYMHASYINLTVDGQDDEEGDIIQPLIIGPTTPDKPYERVVVLCNTGTITGTAYIHFFDVLGHEDEAGIGVGVATSEPELAAEEAVTPLGYDDIGPVYAATDPRQPGGPTNPPLLGADTANLEDYILVTMWWDADDSCSFEDGERIELDSGQYTLPLSQIACQVYELGEIPADNRFRTGGGWGSYFEYNTANGIVVKHLIAGQRFIVGTVTVWYDGANLHVLFETDGGWTMTKTGVYAKDVEPAKSGKKDWYKHEDLPHVTSDEHVIPIAAGTLYIAAHADVWYDGNEETAWAQGKCRKLKLEFVFPDIYEEELGLDLFPGTTDPINHWPTNAYQGDYTTFSIRYTLEGDS